jgi:death-on-curing protein
VSVQYLDLTDYLAIACEVTGLELATVVKIVDIGLADSALHAPMAGFSGQELYSDFVDKAAVLVVRLAKNHPLPDGNKRAAWVSLRLFVELNAWRWAPYPSVDEAEAAVLAVAGGEWREEEAAAWLRQYLRPPEPGRTSHR